jgi:hypothetical protein
MSEDRYSFELEDFCQEVSASVHASDQAVVYNKIVAEAPTAGRGHSLGRN